MKLTTDAERAEDIGDVFSKFKAHVPDHAPDITASVSELYAIGSILRELDTTLHLPQYAPSFMLIDKDLDLVCSSLQDSLQEIFDIVGDMGNGSQILTSSMYRQTWKDIALYFRRNGRMSLKMRLETYKHFMVELANILKRFVCLSILF
jgi:hypothetical protein